MRVKESQTHFVKARWALKQRVAGPTILVLLLAVAAFVGLLNRLGGSPAAG